MKKKLLNEIKIRSAVLKIFSMSGLKEWFKKKINQDSEEEAEVFEDDFDNYIRSTKLIIFMMLGLKREVL